ncbi:Hpt domain-containing protein [Rhodospirillum sp. A1_3_36]|uniref:Hpt domain-containing protein n=1 Tax=Rhodospirillum sp. A1_3_36 TaxID=3391666 RepID=UPI0039A67BF5
MNDFTQYPVHDMSILDAIARDTSPEIVPRLVAIFLKEGIRRRAALAEALACRDREVIGRESHALKSAAASFGCMRLAAQARATDAVYKTGEDETLFALAPLLIASLEEAEAVLQAVNMGE